MMGTRFTAGLFGLALGLLSMGAAVWAQPAGVATTGDQAQALREKVVKAYQDAKTYQATVIFTATQQSGRTKKSESFDYKVALDRAGGKFVLDRPDFALAMDGAKLKLVVPQLAGRHLELTGNGKLEMDAILAALPTQLKGMLAQPALPDVQLLLNADPWKELAGGQPTLKLVRDAQLGSGLQFADAGGGTWTLWIDAKTNLLTQVVVALDVTKMGGSADDKVTLSYDITAVKVNQPVDAAALGLDTSKSQGVNTLQALAGRPAHPLEGKDAPAVALKTLDGKVFKLSEEKAEVVIFDFWATWCGPCRPVLEKMQRISAWAAAQKLPLAIYTVNLQEDPAKVKQFVSLMKLTLPVLLDEEGKAGEAYGVGPIPHTTIIAGGKVVRVDTGTPRDENDAKAAEEELKQLILKLTNKAPAAPADAMTKP